MTINARLLFASLSLYKYISLTINKLYYFVKFAEINYIANIFVSVKKMFLLIVSFYFI